MKRIFSSPNITEVGLLQGRLETLGIRCVVRNDVVSQTIPGAAFAPELWVLNDEDYPKARELVDEWREPASSSDTGNPPG